MLLFKVTVQRSLTITTCSCVVKHVAHGTLAAEGAIHVDAAAIHTNLLILQTFV